MDSEDQYIYIGNYCIVAHLASGAFGSVYLAQHMLLAPLQKGGEIIFSQLCSRWWNKRSRMHKYCAVVILGRAPIEHTGQRLPKRLQSLFACDLIRHYSASPD